MARQLSHWECCMVNTCKHQPNDRISPHPHKYQHTHSSSSAEGRKPNSATETAPHGLLSPYHQSQAQQHTVCPPHHTNDWSFWTHEKCRNSPATLLHVWIRTKLHAVWEAVFKSLTKANKKLFWSTNCHRLFFGKPDRACYVDQQGQAGSG